MRMLSHIARRAIATIAINMKIVSGPWGGSSPFVEQLTNYLKQRGYRVRFDLNGQIDLILIIDPREDLPHKAFGMSEIVKYKVQNKKTIVVHRVNECDSRKNTTFMDPLLADCNNSTDYTIFISEWLKLYHGERWFDYAKPHSVIYNGADSKIFHPFHGEQYSCNENMRIVTHHWSDNPLKGFDVYQNADSLIHQGELKGFELWIVGRWPRDIHWKSAKTFSPRKGHELAKILRQCHLYLTGTRREPCGMHHVEGAQCGLPLVYHLDGGGVVEAGAKYGIGFDSNLTGSLLEAQSKYKSLRDNVLLNMPSGDRMCIDYAAIFQYLIAKS